MNSSALKEATQEPFYAGNNYCEELGLVQPPAGKEWSTHTTLWMMALALLLWSITYLIAVSITMYFDFGFRSIAFNEISLWFNDTGYVNDGLY